MSGHRKPPPQLVARLASNASELYCFSVNVAPRPQNSVGESTPSHTRVSEPRSLCAQLRSSQHLTLHGLMKAGKFATS
jgi:hypothetical protein